MLVPSTPPHPDWPGNRRRRSHAGRDAARRPRSGPRARRWYPRSDRPAGPVETSARPAASVGRAPATDGVAKAPASKEAIGLRHALARFHGTLAPPPRSLRSDSIRSPRLLRASLCPRATMRTGGVQRGDGALGGNDDARFPSFRLNELLKLAAPGPPRAEAPRPLARGGACRLERAQFRPVAFMRAVHARRSCAPFMRAVMRAWRMAHGARARQRATEREAAAARP